MLKYTVARKTKPEGQQERFQNRFTVSATFATCFLYLYCCLLVSKMSDELTSKRKSPPEREQPVAAKQFRITREYIHDVFSRLKAIAPLDTPAVVHTRDAEVANIFNKVTGAQKRTWQSSGKRAGTRKFTTWICIFTPPSSLYA